MSGAARLDDRAVAWPVAPEHVPAGGVFETMLGEDGRVPLLERHLSRLLESAAALGLRAPSIQMLRARVEGTLAGVSPGIHRVRLVLGNDGRTLVEVAPAPAPEPPLRLATVEGTGPPVELAVHKRCGRAAFDAAAAQARRAGGDRALLVTDGLVREADHATCFAAVDDALRTPPPEGILPGVARAIVLERLPVVVAPLPRVDLDRATEIVLTNALRGAIAVASLDRRPLDPDGPWLRRLAAALADAGLPTIR